MTAAGGSDALSLVDYRDARMPDRRKAGPTAQHVLDASDEVLVAWELLSSRDPAEAQLGLARLTIVALSLRNIAAGMDRRFGSIEVAL